MLTSRTPRDELKRQQDALQSALAELREIGDSKLSSQNDAIASNQVEGELGVFRDDGKIAISDQDGFSVKARADALAAKLNSAATLDKIQTALPAMAHPHREVRLVLWLGLAVLCAILWRVW